MTTLNLQTEAEYRAYYLDTFCKRPVMMPLSDGSSIPIYFAAHLFDHAFFESSQRDGIKDEFSLQRAEQMTNISTVLQDSKAIRLQGWDQKKREYNPTRCVTVVTEDEFVIVIRLGLTQRGTLKGKFVTCYVADNSYSKIIKAPMWDEAECQSVLTAS
jgi:hypothetical protein